MWFDLLANLKMSEKIEGGLVCAIGEEGYHHHHHHRHHHLDSPRRVQFVDLIVLHCVIFWRTASHVFWKRAFWWYAYLLLSFRAALLYSFWVRCLCSLQYSVHSGPWPTCQPATKINVGSIFLLTAKVASEHQLLHTLARGQNVGHQRIEFQPANVLSPKGPQWSKYV